MARPIKYKAGRCEVTVGMSERRRKALHDLSDKLSRQRGKHVSVSDIVNMALNKLKVAK